VSTPPPPSPSYELDVEVRDEQDRRRVVLRGELDLSSAPALREAIERVMAEDARAVVLDISALTFIDSTGLRAVLTSRADCERAGASFSIAPAAEQVPPQVRRLLQVTGLLERLPFDAADPGSPPA
jgi:anti-sigma B factor antagonist